VDLAFLALWEEAVPWPAYLEPGMEQYALWKGVYDHAIVPGWALEQFMRGPARRLLVIAADWCGDAANTVPVLARLADLIPALELRILEREKYPAVMNRYLTNGTRSIPIAIALDADFGELGHWGPRPSVLQDWVMARKVMPTPQRYAYARGWYARDKGESTLRELLAAISG
jgi:thioredoxin family protein